MAAIVGHVRPIYLKFGKGGKGVATAAGVFLALAPIQTLLTLIIFAVVLLSSGFVSLGSLTGAVMLPVLLGDHRGRSVAAVRDQRARRASSCSGRIARTSRGCAAGKSIASASAECRRSVPRRRWPSVS